MQTQRGFPMTELSQVGEARRHAQEVARGAAFGPTAISSAGIIVTELATNLVRYATDGHLYVQLIGSGAQRELELLSVDRGPGMVDVSQCLRDGFSSGATQGTGLGAVRRVASTFEIHSEPTRGTVVLARVRDALLPETARAWRWGALSTCAPGETSNGDCWRVAPGHGDVRVLVADGLGHGPLASDAAEEVARVFEETSGRDLKTFFDRAHAALRHLRGAAVAVLVCQVTTGALTFAGVGNISAMILGGDGVMKGMMSHNGTVGAEMRVVRELSYQWELGDRVIMHSDGLRSRWSASDYTWLLRCHPAIVGAALHRDQLRGRDDATIVVIERAS